MPGARTPLVYTPYSLRRLALRGITHAEVQAVMDSRSKTVRPSRHGQGRKVHTAEVEGRRISVVIGVGTTSVNTVVTVWCPDEGEGEKSVAKNRSKVQKRILQMNLEIKGARRPLGIEFDETGTAFYVRIREGRSVVTKAVGDEVLADYDAKGKLLGFEVIGLTEERTATIPEEIRKKHPDEVPQMEFVLA